MGIRERRDVEREEMRTKIRKAAIELIEQDGYEKLSLRKIAAKIEYSPTTIYLYYKDKAKIIADMSNELMLGVVHSVTVFLDNNPSLPADVQLYHILSTVISSLCSEPEMAKTVMYSGINTIFASKDENGKSDNSGIVMMDHLLDEGISEKLLRPGAANCSWMLLSALFGFVMNAIENQLYKLEEFGEIADTFIEIIMKGVKA